MFNFNINPQVVQLLIILLVLGLSGLNWLYRQFKAKAELRRIQHERERRTEHMLRTGRDADEAAPQRGTVVAPAGVPAQGERFQDVAERRRAQLQELRERQQQRRRDEVGSGRRPAPPVVLMGPGAPVAPRPTTRPPQQPPARPRPQPAPGGSYPAPRSVPQRPDPRLRQPQRQPVPQQTRQQGRRFPDTAAPDRRQQAQPQRAPSPAPPPIARQAALPALGETLPEARPTPLNLDLGPVTNSNRKQWHRLIASMEILSKPLSLREEGEGPMSRLG